VATDIQTLWYLRSDLVSLLADYCGEVAAREQVSSITEMFRGIIPDVQFPRAARIRQ
jgi:ubiquinone biosynthesis protein UbiJ